MADTRVYAALLRAGMAGQATYRASFAIELFGTAMGMGLDFVEIFAVFHQVPSVAGLSFVEVVLVFAIASTGFSTADLLVGQTDNVIQHVRDRHVRRGAAAAAVGPGPAGRGRRAAAPARPGRRCRCCCWSSSLVRLDLAWTPARVAMVVVAPVAATVVFAALFVAAGGGDVLGGRRRPR